MTEDEPALICRLTAAVSVVLFKAKSEGTFTAAEGGGSVRKKQGTEGGGGRRDEKVEYRQILRTETQRVQSGEAEEPQTYTSLNLTPYLSSSGQTQAQHLHTNGARTV